MPQRTEFPNSRPLLAKQPSRINLVHKISRKPAQAATRRVTRVVLFAVGLMLLGASMVLSASGATPTEFLTPGFGYLNPAGDGGLINAFNPPPKDWLPGHRGIDLAVPVRETGEFASDGVPLVGGVVVAPGPGQVTFAGLVGGKPVVTVTHPDGLKSSFEPLVATVALGSAVAAGEVIGLVIVWPEHLPPHCEYPCVHWGVRRGETYLDPLILIGAPPIVLMPTN